MSKFSRRDLIRASALGIAFAPAIASASYDPFSPFWKKRSLFQRRRSAAFKHGIASGDPLKDAVIIWTRVSPFKPHKKKQGVYKPKKVLVGWDVATDKNFYHIIRRGRTKVTTATDYTLKVDVQGLLPGKTYYYRFYTRTHLSEVGVTKTLPEHTDQVKLAVMSCSNYPAGFFNVYREVATLDDLDAVIHLGDYIYEYGEGGYATENAEALGRDFEENNKAEIIQLEDYRRRYAQYRSDMDLQSLHAAAPWICVWDDHEVTNDTWREGAENHDDSEGDFFLRKANALKAYFEWMPIRPVDKNNQEMIYRQFSFGNLVNLMMLDTRVVARDEQLSYANYIGADGSFNQAQFTADLTDPNRRLLGDEQLAWLQQSMATSSHTWQVLGQQVLMGRMNLPAEILLNLGNANVLPLVAELATIKGRILAGDPTVTAEERARIETALPYNLDAWDGYFYEREQVLGTAKALEKNLVVFAGDTHNAWANDLQDIQGDAVGVEFATSSVTSPGLEGYLSLPPEVWSSTEQAFELLIDGLKYNNIGDRGFMVATFTEYYSKAEWHYVDTIQSPLYDLRWDRYKAMKVLPKQNKIKQN